MLVQVEEEEEVVEEKAEVEDVDVVEGEEEESKDQFCFNKGFFTRQTMVQ